jgi:hypothetical protein
VTIPPRLRAQLESPADQSGVAAGSVLVGTYGTLGWQELLGLRAQDAIAQFEAAARHFDEVRQPMTFLTLWCITSLGRALLATHQPDRAEGILTRSLQLHQQRQVRITPSRAETLVALAEIHLQRGRAPQALTMAREVDEFWQAFRPSSPPAGEAAIWRGRALIAVGQAAAGQRVIRRGRAALSGSPFADSSPACSFHASRIKRNLSNQSRWRWLIAAAGIPGRSGECLQHRWLAEIRNCG